MSHKYAYVVAHRNRSVTLDEFLKATIGKGLCTCDSRVMYTVEGDMRRISYEFCAIHGDLRKIENAIWHIEMVHYLKIMKEYGWNTDSE